MAGHDGPRAPAHGDASVRAPIPSAGRTALALGALGVVYGDIGTNPLFAVREAFVAHDLPLVEENVVGLLSLIFWSLIVVITVKYVTFVMRVDNEGEGGILALASLLPSREARTGNARWLLLLGLFGAALLYGDGVITPAISVLAAIEGTTVAAPDLDALVVPLAVVVLIALFAVQHRGTAAVGRMFGPVMLIWFATIGLLGAAQIVQHPDVLRALVPTHAVSFFADNGFTGFLVLGAVILVVVGGEALYADLGHFGRRPIALSWYAVVLPSLLLVYFGQGALLIDNPGAIDNPFYRLAPGWALIPLVALATAATVIASQALISGAFSITHQAVQLGYIPRLLVRHTSAAQIGQIYVPAVNWTLAVVCIGLVVGFRRSTGLAGAYGLAVSATMVITTILFAAVVVQRLRWPTPLVAPLVALFLVVDVAFFGSTLFKIPHGGWVPLVIGAVVFTLMTTWRTGKRLVRERRLAAGLPLERFIRQLEAEPPVRAPGWGAYLYRVPGITPAVLLAGLRHQDSLHENVLMIHVEVARRPRVHPIQRAVIEDLGAGIRKITLRFGFLEDPNVPAALAGRVSMTLGIDLRTISYFVGRESVLATARPGMVRWRERLYAAMSRNATDPVYSFSLPPAQVLELGVIVEI